MSDAPPTSEAHLVGATPSATPPLLSSREARSRRRAQRRERILHPVRRRRSALTALVEGEGASEDATEVVRALQTELRKERKEVLEPLLHRLLAFGSRLRQGQDVPIPVIEEGLDLWEAYVQRLYDVHLGQFAAARASLPHTDACALGMAEIEQEPGRADHRIGEVRTMITGYSSRPKLYRPWLGLALFGDATAELSWQGFEEDFANTCLPDHLTPTALQQWNTAMLETRDVEAATREKVQDFLRRTAAYERTPEGSPPALPPKERKAA